MIPVTMNNSARNVSPALLSGDQGLARFDQQLIAAQG
jgi:hypothetical protein